MAGRKGASRVADVPGDILHQLNHGLLETATLVEGLAIDFSTLLRQAAPEADEQGANYIKASDGIIQRMGGAGRALLDQYGLDEYQRFANHPSDTVRGWAAYMLALAPSLDLQDRLRLMRPLADDSHFGVREWAWLAMRPHIAAHLHDAIRILTPWAHDSSANVRRFAVESTRPRGVWCAHIPELKRDPELGLPVLEPVKTDAARYVQDSAANWLNDAAKTQPEWVRTICSRWQTESATAETSRICRRGMRRLSKT